MSHCLHLQVSPRSASSLPSFLTLKFCVMSHDAGRGNANVTAPGRGAIATGASQPSVITLSLRDMYTRPDSPFPGRKPTCQRQASDVDALFAVGFAHLWRQFCLHHASNESVLHGKLSPQRFYSVVIGCQSSTDLDALSLDEQTPYARPACSRPTHASVLVRFGYHCLS